MTRYRVSIGVSLLVAGVVAPRAGQAQDGDQILQQQIQQQMQNQTQQAQQGQQEAQVQAQQAQQSMDQQMQQQSASYRNTVVIPEHLQVGNQHFDASVTGFRSYLEDIKSSDPGLYGQLSPDVERLEAREDAATAVAVGGVVLGLTSVIYGVAGRDTCNDPSITDPHFAAYIQAWGDCNSRNMSKMATFTFVGMGVAVLGGIIAYASWPRHQDLLDLVNKNNHLSKQPLQLNVGYDPTRRFAFSGATVSF